MGCENQKKLSEVDTLHHKSADQSKKLENILVSYFDSQENIDLERVYVSVKMMNNILQAYGILET